MVRSSTYARPLRLAHSITLRGLPLPLDVGQHRHLRRVVVDFVVRRELVVPLQLAGVGVERDDAVAVQVVAETLAAVPVGRGIAGAEVDEVRLGVVRAAVPDAGAAGLPRVARPRLVAGLALAGDRVEAPDFFAGLSRRRRQMNPRTPRSPPAMPTMILSLTTTGAWVMAYFSVTLSPSFAAATSQTILPVFASIATQVRVDRAHVERVAEDRQAAAHAAAARARLERRLVFERPERPAGDGVERDDLVDALDGRPCSV